MSEVRNRRWLQRALYSPVSICVLAGAAVLSGIAAWNMYQTYQHAAERRAASSEEVAQLKKREAELEEAVSELSTPRGREGRIREDLGLAEEGETMIVITEKPVEDVQTTERTPPGFLASLWASIKVFFK